MKKALFALSIVMALAICTAATATAAVSPMATTSATNDVVRVIAINNFVKLPASAATIFENEVSPSAVDIVVSVPEPLVAAISVHIFDNDASGKANPIQLAKNGIAQKNAQVTKNRESAYANDLVVGVNQEVNFATMVQWGEESLNHHGIQGVKSMHFSPINRANIQRPNNKTNNAKVNHRAT